MRIFGFEVSRAKAAPPVLSPPARGWNRILEPYTGAWQAGVEINQQDVGKFGPTFACMSLISADIGKLRPRLMRRKGTVWQEDPASLPVLRNPNLYQTTQQFVTNWVNSLLSAGNTYTLLERDARGTVTGAWVLNPDAVTPLVTPNGTVYYKLKADNLAGLEEGVIVSAREIIHDRINCLYHPLMGISPLWAAGLAAQTGANIGKTAAAFFANAARPGGILTAPGQISDENALRLKEAFDGFVGAQAGAVAVVGDGLKYEQLAVNSTDAQLLEMLKLSAEQVASVFKVPAFMIGAAPAPAVANAELLQQQYYKSCLQSLIEGIENGLDAGLELDDETGIELDVEGGLLRLDTAARFASYESAMRAGWLAPNEARAKENLPPVVGGDSPMVQMQNYSLEALARRDDSPTPFAPPGQSGQSKELEDRVKELEVTVVDFVGLLKSKVQHARGTKLNGIPLSDGRIYMGISDPDRKYQEGQVVWVADEGFHELVKLSDGGYRWVPYTAAPDDLLEKAALWQRGATSQMKSAAPLHKVGEIVEERGQRYKCVGPNRYRAIEAEEATS